MRITIATRIFSPEPSAASFMLDALARAFREEGHRVTVLTTRVPGPPAPAPDGVAVSRAPVLRDRHGYVRGYLPYLSFDIPLAFRMLFSRRADLYFVEPPPTTGAVVRVVAGLLRRPYFYDAADLWSDAARLATDSRLILALLRRIELFAMRGARRAFAVSTGVAERMHELGVDTPTTVVGFGVDTAVFDYRGAPVAPRRAFIYGGTYSEWHGAGIFVEAFARFRTQHPGFRLVFVGNGSDRSKLEAEVARLELSDVEFLDPVPGQELDAMLNQASASLASLRPGGGYDYAFTTKVYSSLAAGCPVLFAGVGPTAAFLADASRPAGRAVAYEVEAVAAAMAAFAESPLAEQDRADLSGWVRESFSLTMIAAGIARACLEEAG